MLKHVPPQIVLGLSELLLEHCEVTNSEHVCIVGACGQSSRWHEAWLHYYHYPVTSQHLDFVDLVIMLAVSAVWVCEPRSECIERSGRVCGVASVLLCDECCAVYLWLVC